MPFSAVKMAEKVASSHFDSSTAYFRRLGSPVAAVATAAGGPVGVIRISGEKLNFLEPLLGPLPEAGTFRYRALEVLDPLIGRKFIVDRALVLYFKAPASFTGEDVIEIQVHGIASVLEIVLGECLSLGAIFALPGEFSFRAVLNSKMSLEEAEGIQSAFASESLGPYWASKLLGVRKSGDEGVSLRLAEALASLVALRGRVEAAIDFPEAENEQGEEIASALLRLKAAQKKLSSLLSSFEIFSASSREFSFAIVGQPNAGKSTLLNLLAGGKKALVSSIPGTTRDVVESRYLLRTGLWLKLQDTAGLRQSSGIEREGMELGLEVAAQASALIWVRSLESTADFFAVEAISRLARPTIEIFSHQDKVGSRHPRGFDFVREGKEARDFLEDEISKLVRTETQKNLLEFERASSIEALISNRQKVLIESALGELKSAELCLLGERPIEVVSEHVRAAESGLHKAIGKDAGEAYIGQIFGQFCLGK